MLNGQITVRSDTACRLSPEAQTDLSQLYLHISERSGAARAIGFIERIEARCFSLRDFPERGTRRDDLWPGLRVTGFERRVSIAFVIAQEAVTILRVLYGGRDLEATFASDETAVPAVVDEAREAHAESRRR